MNPEAHSDYSHIVKIRHHLHAHPELRFEERATSSFVAKILRENGLSVEEGIGGYGVVATLKRGTSDKAIALRADMDALPLQELNTFQHASQHGGKMHACGHDGHTAILLGAAMALSRSTDFDGTLHFVFQPAEEGGAGAKRMIDDGLFERFKIDAIYGIHNWPGLPAGSFGVRQGGLMASSNTFNVKLSGKGSHAGQPHQSVDPVMAAVHLAQALQTILSRNVDPNVAAVLSVTQIHAGTADNIIPERATLSGTVRTFDSDTLDLIENRMAALTDNVAAAFAVDAEFHFNRLYPALINHDRETQKAVEAMVATVGHDRVQAQIDRSFASEDFSFFLQQKPGCYAFLGNGVLPTDCSSDMPISQQLHSPLYDFNDDIIAPGISYWLTLVKTALPRQA
ncbi:M20 aminoacylase family protein [Chitinasiproducens palmae]|uniref:Hippurate hydrolase n=1 Tax=Chitinasiproducens palmae TaxID=1770053 RepID=A0A1H2PL66_9BURK|nr:M20 aminoacylase family protein [Chitinasiproducens palmae]SDV47189.1 hippurate hydrolase [Chitinasiproducens palmae]